MAAEEKDQVFTRERRRVVMASAIGTTLEWYDFFLYGAAAALVFPQLFFPGESETVGTLLAFSTYAAGFFARPVGGLIFGHFGDRVSRRNMLIISITIMGIATFLIGLLPTFDTIGVAAPILLVLLRIVQGFGVGGEWGGAVLMSTEYAPKGRRGLFGSFVQIGVPAGLLLSTVVFLAVDAIFSEAALFTIGWRIPFLISIVLVAVGLFIRLRVLESPVFSEVKEGHTEAKIPLAETFRTEKRSIATAMAARIGENALFYLFTVFVLEYGETELGFERSSLLIAVVIASAIGLFTVPFFGSLSDRLGRRPVYLFGAIVSVFFSFAYIGMLNTGSLFLIVLATVIGLNVVHDAQYGPQAAFFAESFSTQTRYTGASIGYQLAAPLGGGIAPIVATALIATGENGPLYFAIYMAAMSLITVIGVLAAKETYKRDFTEDVRPASGAVEPGGAAAPSRGS
jgi:metabolite-proton symporter